MTDPVKCPQCTSENIYKNGHLWACPDCEHEWTADAATASAESTSESNQIKDAYGNVLQTGDSVTVIKDLKIKGASSSVKVGTKVKNIRLIEDDNGHNIACKIDGVGALNLKSEFVKKS